MSYQEFAYYYDSLMDPKFYEDYMAFLDAHVNFHKAIELGCGTGEMTFRLLEEGKDLIATDLSDDMLEVLAEKAEVKGMHFPMYRMDMCDFDIDEEMDAVLCFCDSLNYIIDLENVKKVFINAYHALQDQGCFVFDVDSLYKCNVILKDYEEESSDEDYFFHWDVKTDGKGEILHHVIIKDQETHHYVDEIHHQKTYDVSVYKQLLEEAGFHHIELYSDFGEYKEECERHIFVCFKED
jgi:SAM-dependent methyltransferase